MRLTQDQPAPDGRQALLDSLAVSNGGRIVRVLVLLACTIPVVLLLDLPMLLAWLAVLLIWDAGLVRPLERRWVLPVVDTRLDVARRRRAAMVLFGLSLTQVLPLAAWSTGQTFGAVVGACWIMSTSTHVLIYYSRDRLLLAAGMIPTIACALIAPSLGGLSWASAAMSLFVLMSLGAGWAFVGRSDALLASVAQEAAGRRSAEAASLAKTRFIAKMHHELRTPLNAIIGYSEMLRESANDNGRHADAADLDRVLNAARLQLMMMQDLLAFSELQDGDVKPAASLCNAAAVAQAATGEVRQAALARGNVVTTHLDRSLEVVSTDADRLGQCLSQLLSNAVKFTENGDIEVTGRRVRDQHGDWIEFKVRDTGVGIRQSELERIFEPFTQADDSGVRAPDGTGLGLAIVSRNAQLLGGAVSAESTPGRGSTFTLRVRADLAAADDARSAAVP